MNVLPKLFQYKNKIHYKDADLTEDDVSGIHGDITDQRLGIGESDVRRRGTPLFYTQMTIIYRIGVISFEIYNTGTCFRNFSELVKRYQKVYLKEGYPSLQRK